VNTLIYLAAAVLCGLLGWRAWTVDRASRLRRSFLLVGGLAAISYGAFGIFLLLGIWPARQINAVAGAWVPVATLTFLVQLMGEAPRGPGPMQLRGLTALVCLAYLGLDYAEFRNSDLFPRNNLTHLGLALWVGYCFFLCLRFLFELRQRREQAVDRARIRYLLILLCAAVGFTLLEQLSRYISSGPGGQPLQVSLLSPLQRALVVQGHVPPVGVVWGSLFVYFLYQVVQARRLIDLDEAFSRMVVLATTSAVLAAWCGVTALLIHDPEGNPVALLFQLFLSAALYLAFYDPLRSRMEALAGEWFNREGRRLELTLSELNRALPKVISLEGLGTELLQRLHASGRAPQVSLYLWDAEQGCFRLHGHRGPDEHPLMRTIAPRPFTEGFMARQKVYERRELADLVERRLPGHDAAALQLRTLEAMEADLCIPLRSGETVLGWLNLRDESWSDGYSQDELDRLVRTADRAALILENIHSFAQMEEQHRLAALGTMSAGLAHEIRNPLAGIKGAAQYLQGATQGADPAELREFLDVIVSETDRLNGVVSQFLDYARPLEVQASPMEPAAILRRVVEWMRVQGLPPGLELATEVEPDLPLLEVDADKVHQVMLNLVLNAEQSLGGRGRIELRAARGDLGGGRGRPCVELSVSDNGPGIAPEVMDQLFIPFFTTRSRGTGLGLPLSRRLVEAHQGELAVRSSPGKGATFVVRLPLPETAVRS
jgi:two-component system, NtrC family, sensor histidine kinase HydH